MLNTIKASVRCKKNQSIQLTGLVTLFNLLDEFLKNNNEIHVSIYRLLIFIFVEFYNEKLHQFIFLNFIYLIKNNENLNLNVLDIYLVIYRNLLKINAELIRL